MYASGETDIILGGAAVICVPIIGKCAVSHSTAEAKEFG